MNPPEFKSHIMLSISYDSIRLQNLEKRLKSAEERIKKLESTPATIHRSTDSQDADSVTRVKNDLLKRNVFSYRLVRVPGDYYDRNLSERATMLSSETHQLCKRL
jgi:hypothetical protein